MIRWFPMPAEVVQAHLATTGAYVEPATEMMASLEYGFIHTSGQTSFWTERRLSERWKWSKSKVHRLILSYADQTEKRVDQEWTKNGPKPDQEKIGSGPEADQKRTTEHDSGAVSEPSTGPKAVSSESEADQNWTKPDAEKSLARASSSYTLTGFTSQVTSQEQSPDQEQPPNPLPGGSGTSPAGEHGHLDSSGVQLPAPNSQEETPNSLSGAEPSSPAHAEMADASQPQKGSSKPRKAAKAKPVASDPAPAFAVVDLPTFIAVHADKDILARLLPDLIKYLPELETAVAIRDAYLEGMPKMRNATCAEDMEAICKRIRAEKIGRAELFTAARAAPLDMWKLQRGQGTLRKIFASDASVSEWVQIGMSPHEPQRRSNGSISTPRPSTRNAFGGRQEGIDWDAEFASSRRG